MNVAECRSRRGWIAFAALAALGGCEACGEDDSVAELVEIQRTVERDHAAHVETWEGAAEGARFVIGDGVRTKTGSRATLRLGREGAARLVLEEETTVRFQRRPGGEGAAIDVGMGAAILEAGDDGYDLGLRFGVAHLAAGARARLSAGDDGLGFAVTMGSAVYEGEGPQRTLSEGEGLLIDFGGAVLDPDTEEADAGPPDAGAVEAPPEELPPPASTGFVLRRLEGRGQLRTEARGPWAPLEEGDTEIAPGASVRVADGGRYELSHGADRVVLRGTGEYVIGEGDALARVTRGGATVSAAAGDVALLVPGGRIVARGGEGAAATEVDVRSNRSTRVRAQTGTTEVEGSRDRETLLAGEEAVLDARGSLAGVAGRGPARADFVVGAGGSITVHDPRPPTALGLRFPETCTGRGVIELLRGSGGADVASAGEGSANLSLPSGSHRYRVRCAGGEGAEVATGNVRVVRDTGVQPLPPSAPTSVIDTDGRTYRVMYQTHLPEIIVRWPRAPTGGGGYALVITSPGAPPRVVRSSIPRVTIESGALRVGTHSMRFETSGQASRATPVEVRFDNAMSTATLRSPGEGSFGPGETVQVDGIAVPGWGVWIDGRETPLAAGGRFSGTVTAPSGTNGFAIELRHPSRGRHFYLRRARGGASASP